MTPLNKEQLLLLRSLVSAAIVDLVTTRGTSPEKEKRLTELRNLFRLLVEIELRLP